jgi:hypothetical protein
VDDNRVGTSPAGTILPGVDLGNAGHGVAVLNSQGNEIGAGLPGNTIASNGGSGVYVEGAAAQYNSIQWNSIFSNRKLGIDLVPAPGAEGVTPNDPRDADAGPNFLQNFPVITSATTSVGGTIVRFTLNSEPSRHVTLILYFSPAPDPSGYGEGASFGGVAFVTTDSTGHVSGVLDTPRVVPAGGVVTATASIQDGMMRSTSEFSQAVQAVALVAPAVVRRQVFFNNSAFDGRDPAPNAADDAAIVTVNWTKPLLPGSTTFDAGNYTNYTRGINGVMIDVLGLPAGAESSLGPDDFTFRTTTGAGGTTWRPAPPPKSVTVRRGAGVGGTDRVTLLWDDYQPGGTSPNMAVANGWLEVTVKANADTGLAQPDVFTFGNLIGDDNVDTRGAVVDALDLALIKRSTGRAEGILDTRDFNHDNRINALDLAAVKRNLGRSLAMPVIADPPATLATARRTATDWLPA